MELKPVYKLIPTEDHIMEIEIPILKPKDVEITIKNLRNKLTKFMENNYAHIFDTEKFIYSNHLANHLNEISFRYKNNKLTRMLALLYITYYCNSYSNNIYVNWKDFDKFVKYEKFKSIHDIQKYHSDLISSYLVNDIRQKHVRLRSYSIEK